MIRPDSLGSSEFRSDYGLRYAYLAGGMYKGIASKELVVALGRAGLMGYFGSGGLDLQAIDTAVRFIQTELRDGQAFGVNLLCNPERPDLEEQTVDLFLARGVRNVEAAAYMRMTRGLVHWRVRGLRRAADGSVHVPRRTLAKVSRPETARLFLQPAPEAIVRDLLVSQKITSEEAALSREVPMADDLCVEADSGGHTDQGVAYALMPTMLQLRDAAMSEYRYRARVRVGAAGGIGTPQAAAAAFVMGADFILTGSINQCTIEAGTSEPVKDLLQELEIQDTDYAPAGDMFELGARVQVAKRGLFFPARANKLYELYTRHRCLEEIDAKMQTQIQERYFQRSFGEVWNETSRYYSQVMPQKMSKLAANPKEKMALVFKWYFVQTTRLALRGELSRKVDYQIHCGPAMGAFNHWVNGTALKSWRRRRVAELGALLMEEAATLLSQRFQALALSH